jgi:hypothetical protein
MMITLTGTRVCAVSGGCHVEKIRQIKQLLATLKSKVT